MVEWQVLQVQKYLSQFGFIEVEFDKFLAKVIVIKQLLHLLQVKKLASKGQLTDNTEAWLKWQLMQNKTLFGGEGSGSYSYGVSAI